MSRKQQYSDDELWDIVKKHKEAFTSVGAWNKYAKEHCLPHSQTFIQRLGSWNEIKKKLGLQTSPQHRTNKYSESELLKILEIHGSHFQTTYGWNIYAREHQLPSHQVFEKYIGLEKLEELTPFQASITKEKISHQLKQYFPYSPPTTREWDEVVKEHSLISVSTIIRYFGSWNNMKKIVYNKEE